MLIAILAFLLGVVVLLWSFFNFPSMTTHAVVYPVGQPDQWLPSAVWFALLPTVAMTMLIGWLAYLVVRHGALMGGWKAHTVKGLSYSGVVLSLGGLWLLLAFLPMSFWASLF